MQDFVIIGECLVELSRDLDGHLQQGFAGDVYSVAVYLKRANPKARVRLLCAIGNDPFSDALVASLEAEGVETSLLLRHPERNIGLYSIENAEDGERSFTYWRSEAAARATLDLLQQTDYQLLNSPPDCFYLTGISLAVLEAETPGDIWPLVESLSAAGTRIVFDTNYRPRLWSGAETAQRAFDKALEHSDLVLPGVEDMEMLYGISSPADIGGRLENLGVKQMVLKDGPADILYGEPTAPKQIAVSPVKNVVDTTAAGDSFSGTLLAGLSRGLELVDAIDAASAVSAQVIQHRGAILPR